MKLAESGLKLRIRAMRRYTLQQVLDSLYVNQVHNVLEVKSSSNTLTLKILLQIMQVLSASKKWMLRRVSF